MFLSTTHEPEHRIISVAIPTKLVTARLLRHVFVFERAFPLALSGPSARHLKVPGAAVIRVLQDSSDLVIVTRPSQIYSLVPNPSRLRNPERPSSNRTKFIRPQ